MYERYDKRFLERVIDSLAELLSGDKPLGGGGLCLYLRFNTDKAFLSYDFVEDFMCVYNTPNPGEFGKLTENRILLARKIISETRKYIEG